MLLFKNNWAVVAFIRGLIGTISGIVGSWNPSSLDSLEVRTRV